MRKVCLITILLLVMTSFLVISADDTNAEDSVLFENDTRETAMKLEMGTREDSISDMDYFDYFIIEEEIIDLYRVMWLKVTFIDVPGSGFIEVRTFLSTSDMERDYAYLDRDNMTETIAFDSQKVPQDLYVEISGYGNYSIELKGEKGEGQTCWICDIFGMVIIAPLSLGVVSFAVIKKFGTTKDFK